MCSPVRCSLLRNKFPFESCCPSPWKSVTADKNDGERSAHDMTRSTWHRGHSIWHVARGTLNVARGTWHVKRETWHVKRDSLFPPSPFPCPSLPLIFPSSSKHQGVKRSFFSSFSFLHFSLFFIIWSILSFFSLFL